MPTKRLIFVSAVSNEFHHASVEQWRDFESYRDALRHAFHSLDPSYKVVTQEDLIPGFSGLLQTLDREVVHSLIVIHLVGHLAGEIPQLHERRRLYKRHTNLLSNIPELRGAIGDGNQITYTQWELYLAFHHDKPVLVFEAQSTAPRSPRFAPTSTDLASQTTHRQRIEMTGHHRGTFQDQGDVARKSIRSFIHWRTDPAIDPTQPLPEDLAHARVRQAEIVAELVRAIKRPDPRAVPVRDPANTAAFIAAVRAVAMRWQVNMADVIDIAANYEETVRAVLSDRPGSEALYQEGFARFALGDFTAACFSARRAADVALTDMHREHENSRSHLEAAERALLLLHDAAKAASDAMTAIASLEEAAPLIDKEEDPVRWADFNETLVRFLLEQGVWDRAEELINEIVDIREDHQAATDALGRALLLWSALLDVRANYQGVESVAARAELIFASQTPVNVDGIISALTHRGDAVINQNRLAEGEQILLQVVALAEVTYGAESEQVAIPLGNLAELLHIMNRLDEAEALMHRTLVIDEKNYGPEHPKVAIHLNNLGSLLRHKQQFEDAEKMLRRSLAIREKIHRPEHPVIAVSLKNLGEILLEKRRLAEAEPLIRRALKIEEQSYGPDHPKVALSLNNLASMLAYGERFGEAEPVIRRALAIEEKYYGMDHPNVANPLNTLALLLIEANRLAEAEPLLRRALLLLRQASQMIGYEHPRLRKVEANYRVLLKRMGQEP